MNAWLSVKIISLKLRLARAKLARQEEFLNEINRDYIEATRGKRAIIRKLKALDADLIKAKADLMTARAINPHRRFPLGF